MVTAVAVVTAVSMVTIVSVVTVVSVVVVVVIVAWQQKRDAVRPFFSLLFFLLCCRTEFVLSYPSAAFYRFLLYDRNTS
jgi:hypothetical protein